MYDIVESIFVGSCEINIGTFLNKFIICNAFSFAFILLYAGLMLKGYGVEYLLLVGINLKHTLYTFQQQQMQIEINMFRYSP